MTLCNPGSFRQITILCLVTCSILCFTSADISPSRFSLVVPKPFAERTNNNNYYYNASYNNDRKGPGLSRPASDREFAADRRGAFDSDGRTLIFKSLILAPLALVVLILFFVLLVPIPVISNPIGRSYQSSSSNALSSSMYTLQMAREVLTAEECVERVSCELSKISRSYDSTSWIPSTLEKLLMKTKWSDRIIRGINGISPSACSQFTCTPAKNLKKTLRNASAVH